MKNIQFNFLAVISGLFCMTLAAGALAEQIAGPCSEDVAKLCKGVQQGEGRIAQCLKAHASELSPACREHAVEVKEKVHDFASACKGDMTKLCSAIKPGGGRLVQCLKQHESELSTGCREKMTQAAVKQQ